MNFAFREGQTANDNIMTVKNGKAINCLLNELHLAISDVDEKLFNNPEYYGAVYKRVEKINKDPNKKSALIGLLKTNFNFDIIKLKLKAQNRLSENITAIEKKIKKNEDVTRLSVLINNFKQTYESLNGITNDSFPKLKKIIDKIKTLVEGGDIKSIVDIYLKLYFVSMKYYDTNLGYSTTAPSQKEVDDFNNDFNVFYNTYIVPKK
jgi:hypothetical protein